MEFRFRKEEKERLEEVRCYIDAHLHAALRIGALCTLAAMNRHKLNAGFERFYGKQVRLYILERRMEKARLLLQETDDQLEDIAEACGYGHPSNLGVAYKRYFGYPPNEERKRLDGRRYETGINPGTEVRET